MSYIPCEKLKKRRVVMSHDVFCASHCAMDVALEELWRLDDVNVFVLGVGECAFYSGKVVFEPPRINRSYTLTDREIVFGDMSAAAAALADVCANGLTTVCLVTCVPSVMNPDLTPLEEIKGAVVVKTPDFEGISPYDIMGKVYKSLLKMTDGPKSGTAFWDGRETSLAALRKKLSAATHIVNNRDFLPALSEIGGVNVIDNVNIHGIDFYNENAAALGLDKARLRRAAEIACRIAEKRKSVTVMGRSAYGVAAFLRSLGADVRAVCFADYNAVSYLACRNLGNVAVSLDYADPPPDGTTLLDYSSADGELAGKNGFDKLCAALNHTEKSCL